MNDLILYHALISTCAQKVRFVLGHKQLRYESRIIDFVKSEQLEDWYLAINPNGVVPTLTHGAHPIIDSSVIAEYLDEIFPEPQLSPTNPVERAAMRAWMRYFEEVPTTAIRVPSFNLLFARTIAARGEEINRAQRERMPLRKQFYARMGNDGFDAVTTRESEERLRSCLERVERAIASKGPYILGSALTLADIVLLPSVVRMDDLGMAASWDDLTNVTSWYDLMQQQPGFDVAYPQGARVNPQRWNFATLDEHDVATPD